MPIIAVFSEGVADLIPWNLIPSIRLPEYDGAVSESGKIAECAGVVSEFPVSDSSGVSEPVQKPPGFNMFKGKKQAIFRLPQLVSNHLAKECGGKSWGFQMLRRTMEDQQVANVALVVRPQLCVGIDRRHRELSNRERPS